MGGLGFARGLGCGGLGLRFWGVFGLGFGFWGQGKISGLADLKRLSRGLIGFRKGST